MAEKKEKEKEAKEEKPDKEYGLSDLPGIGPTSVEKLESAGIYDLMGIAVLTPSALAEMAGMGEAVARKTIQAARKMMKLGFSDGLEFAKKRESVCHITTGSKNLDALLGGKGVETKAMTEAFGAYGSGKCVSKDTIVSYFNDSKLHVQSIQETYEKYKNNEFSFEDGFAIPVDNLKVLAFLNNKINITKVSHIYREKVKKLFLAKTRRGRILKITGNHQFLTFDNKFLWKKAKELNKGDVIVYPKELKLEGESKILTEDDAYFLGFFVAEGTKNPFSLCNSNEAAIAWIKKYIERRFGYSPKLKIDKRRDTAVYTVLLKNQTKEIMYGLEETDSSTKFIPEDIFNSNEKVIASFLAGYLEGDAELGKDIVAVTTKSKKLASQLTYLFLRIGMSATIKKKIVKGREFSIIFVVGEDRLKINELPFKFKESNIHILNTEYGYPKQIISFLRENYKESIGSNRGRQRKEIGKINSDSMAYRHLTHNPFVSNMNSKTLNSIKNLFLEGKNIIDELISNLSEGEMSLQKLKKIFNHLPFAFSILAEKFNMKKSSIRNYNSRKIPEDKKELLKKYLLEELKNRKMKIDNLLEFIETLMQFNYDTVKEIEEIDYDDYVYDFVVPEGHSFIGGNMPTILHNTQLGLSLAVNVQMPPDMGGANGKAVFIDTESTFRPERIKQIAEAIGANPEKILKNIFVARAFNSDHQILLIDKIGEMIKNGEPIKVVIIDSLTAHFRAEYAGRGQLADRQQKLNRYLHNLMKIAEQYNLAIYVTNQVMANPAMMFGDPTTPVGGNIVGHACLTGDSLIQLADGSIKEIKDMKQEKVISSNFRKMNLENAESDFVFINPEVDEIYKIKTNNQINCSSLHRFFTIKNFSLVEKESKDLRKGDFLAQAGKINIVGEEQKLPVMNLKKIGKISKEDSVKVKEELERDMVTREEICKKIGITKRQFRRVLNQNWPTNFETLSKLSNYFSGRLQLQILPVQTYKHRNLIIPEIMNAELAQICGYFLGDGNLESGGLRFRAERIRVLQSYNLFFNKIFNLSGNITKVKDKNCYNLSINSREITEFFRLIVPCIFDYIGKSKEDVVKAFIKGFVDAEGHVDKKRAMITIAQKEKQVLRYLQLFLLRLGIRSTIKFDIGRKKINVLRISCRDVKDYLQIGFTAKDKESELLRQAEKINLTYDKEMMPIRRKDVWNLLKEAGLFPSKFIKPRSEDYEWINRRELENAFNALMNCEIKDRQIKQKINFIFKLLNSDIRFEKIREINIKDNSDKELFYDFSVPERENYVADGFIVHNSTYRLYFRRGKKGSRVAKMIDSPNLPENEAIFFLTANGLRDEE